MATSVKDFLQKNPNYIGYSNTANRTAPQVKQRGRGGFLSSLISEIGGAGGALGGAAAGAAAGSIVPGIGNLVGGIIGAGIGGFTGGAGGRLVENKVRDNEYRLGDALKEGALSGAFGAAGSGFQAARGLKAVGGLKGLQAATAAGGDDALVAASKSILTGGKKAGISLANGGFDDLAMAAKSTAGRNAAERTGGAMYRSTLGIDDIVMPGQTKPTTLFKADELAKEAQKIGLKGTPAQMQRQLGVQYERFNTQVAQKLAESTKTRGFKEIYKSTIDDISKQLPIRVESTPVKEELVRTLNNTLKPLAEKGKLNASAVSAFKNSLDVDSAFKKISLGSNLTAKETVDLALWKHADNVIKDLAPAAKELTTRQSKLYGLAQGLGRMTRTPGDPQNLSNLAIRVASPVVRDVQNATGRALTKVGGVQAGIKESIPGFVGPVAKGTVARGVGNQMFNPSAPAESGAGVEQDTTLYGPTAIQSALSGGMTGERAPSQAPQQSPYPLEAALADMQRDPQHASDYIKYYQFFDKATTPDKESVKAQDAAYAGNNALNIVSQLEQAYNQAGGAQGRLGGLASTLAGKAGANDAVSVYNDNKMAFLSNVARSLGEKGVLTDQDIERIAKAFPSPTSTKQEAAAKWAMIKTIINRGLSNATKSYGGSDSGGLSSLLGESY